MEKEWVAIIGVGVGASLSGLLSFVNSSVAYRRDRKEKRREERIRCLEDVIASTDSVSAATKFLYTNMAAAIVMKQPQNFKDVKIPDFPISRLQLVVRLRFPSLAPLLDQVEKTHTACGGTLLNAIRLQASGDDASGGRELIKLMENVQEVENACKKLKDTALELGRRDIS